MYRCCKTAVWNTWVLSGDLNDVDNGILHSVSHHITRQITTNIHQCASVGVCNRRHPHSTTRNEELMGYVRSKDVGWVRRRSVSSCYGVNIPLGVFEIAQSLSST